MLREIERSINIGYQENIVAGNTFELIETDPNATCRTARFRKKGGEVLAYKFDRSINVTNTFGNVTTIETAFPFFSNIAGIKAMADFLLFYQKENGDIFVIICNLKSGNKSNSQNQFNAAEIFAYFLIESIKRQFSLNIQIDFVRRVLFATKQLYKFNKNDWNDKAKRHIPITFQCVSSSICPLDAICN
jgi:hypothetical protein